MSIFFKILFHFAKFGFKHQKYMMPVLKSFLFYNKDVRISVAAVLLLEKDNKFLLIKNNHRNEYYTPIGGVYKHVERLPQILHDIEWAGDFTKDEQNQSEMRNDLRGIIQGKNLSRFITWFSTHTGRECERAIYRELDEELSEDGVSQSWRDKSSKVTVELLRTVIEGPRKVEGRPYKGQYRSFEIYSFDPSCKTGQDVLDELFKRASTKTSRLIAVTRKEIDDGRIHACRSAISGSSKYYFSSKWHGNEPTPY